MCLSYVSLAVHCLLRSFNLPDAGRTAVHPPVSHETSQFLGYRFEAGRRFVRAKSLKAFKDKLRARTIRSRGDSLERVIADINPMLRGWFGYFKHARPRLFRSLDGLIRQRLRAILRKQGERPSMGRSEADHRRWTNDFFAAMGLFTMQAAHHASRHSR